MPRVSLYSNQAKYTYMYLPYGVSINHTCFFMCLTIITLLTIITAIAHYHSFHDFEELVDRPLICPQKYCHVYLLGDGTIRL